MERFFTGRELVNTSSRLDWNAALNPFHSTDSDPVLSDRVGVVGVNTIRDYSKLSRLKISKLNMFDIFSFVGSASAV